MMRGLIRLVNQNFSKKLGIAETAKVIQEKILNITQVVLSFLSRMTLRNSEQSSVLVTVLPELWDSTKFKPEKWSRSDQALEVWPSI
jgi:hypothetical protein